MASRAYVFSHVTGYFQAALQERGLEDDRKVLTEAM